MATITITIASILSIVLGILILARPKILRIALGLYFLAIGILGIIDI